MSPYCPHRGTWRGRSFTWKREILFYKETLLIGEYYRYNRRLWKRATSFKEDLSGIQERVFNMEHYRGRVLPCFAVRLWDTQGLPEGLNAFGPKVLESNYYSTLTPLRETKIQRRRRPVERGGSWGVSEGNCFVCKLCYCTVFGVLLCMWQCVCGSYCCQLNAVSLSTDTSCSTVQIHIQCADWVLFRYTSGIFSVLL